MKNDHAMIKCPICDGQEAEKLWRSDKLARHIKAIHPASFEQWLKEKEEAKKAKGSSKRATEASRKQAERDARGPWQLALPPVGVNPTQQEPAPVGPRPGQTEERFVPKLLVRKFPFVGPNPVPSPAKKTMPNEDIKEPIVPVASQVDPRDEEKLHPPSLAAQTPAIDADGFMVPVCKDAHRHKGIKCPVCGSLAQTGRVHTAAACKRACALARKRSGSSLSGSSIPGTPTTMSGSEESVQSRRLSFTWDLAARTVTGPKEGEKHKIYKESEVFRLSTEVPLWPEAMPEHGEDDDCSSEEETVRRSAMQAECLLEGLGKVDPAAYVGEKLDHMQTIPDVPYSVSAESFRYTLEDSLSVDVYAPLDSLVIRHSSRRNICTGGLMDQRNPILKKYQRDGVEEIKLKRTRKSALWSDPVFRTSARLFPGNVAVNFFSGKLAGVPPEPTNGTFAIVLLFNAGFTKGRAGKDGYLSVNDKGSWMMLSGNLEILCASGVCPCNYKDFASRILEIGSSVGQVYSLPKDLVYTNTEDCNPWDFDERDHIKFKEIYTRANHGQENAIKTLAEQVGRLEGHYRRPTRPNLWLVHGPAGTGKSMVLDAVNLYAKIHGVQTKVVALSLQAALVHETGQTAHSVFRITLDSNPKTKCESRVPGMVMLSDLGLLLFDEAFACSKYVLGAVDQELRKYHNPSLPFGGIMVVFFGDPRQLLPIPEAGQDPTKITIVDTPFWKDIIRLELTENMRTADPALRELQEQAKTQSIVHLPDSIRVKDIGELYSFVYPDLGTRYYEPDYFAGRVVLVARKIGVNKHNRELLKQLPGEEVILEGKSPKMPELAVKKGCPLICIKNIPGGPHNGARLQFVGYDGKVVKAMSLAGKTKGIVVEVKRVQVGNVYILPLVLGFAMTVHKAQGQTYEEAEGVDLTYEMKFALNAGYVVFSRTHSIAALRVYSKHSDMVNMISDPLVWL